MICKKWTNKTNKQKDKHKKGLEQRTRLKAPRSSVVSSVKVRLETTVEKKTTKERTKTQNSETRNERSNVTGQRQKDVKTP